MHFASVDEAGIEPASLVLQTSALPFELFILANLRNWGLVSSQILPRLLNWSFPKTSQNKRNPACGLQPLSNLRRRPHYPSLSHPSVDGYFNISFLVLKDGAFRACPADFVLQGRDKKNPVGNHGVLMINHYQSDRSFPVPNNQVAYTKTIAAFNLIRRC